MEKYKISKTTYHTIVKKLRLKRPKTSKLLRTFNMNFTDDNKIKDLEKKPKASHIPIDDVYNKVEETDEKLLYEKQYVPRNTTINVEKQKTTTKPKPKLVVKEQIEEPKKDESNNKSELLNAINRSTKIREKILNKKNIS